MRPRSTSPRGAPPCSTGRRWSCGWWAISSSNPGGLDSLAAHFFREEYGRLVGRLVRVLGPDHLGLAEDAVQEALASAVRTWPLRGVPDDPAAWLATVARNAATDAVRRSARLSAALRSLAAEGTDGAPVSPEADQLDLAFLCCHPRLPRSERVVLTLKVVAGFGTDEVAAAFLVPVATVAQRIVRAKRRIRDQGLTLDGSSEASIVERLPSVLDVIYLVFNHGYTIGPGEAGLRTEFAGEALRLLEILAARHPRPEVHALAALCWLQSSRFEARIDPAGVSVPLRDQDRSRWDGQRIGRGLHHLSLAGRGETLSDFHLLAGIAACHAVGSGETTDWARVLDLYDTLLSRTDTPVAALNRIVAWSMVHGASEALPLLDDLDRTSTRPPRHLMQAARADLLERAGRAADAAGEFQRAAQIAPNEPERLSLLRRASAAHDTR
ncbi:MAG TPA: sigma-70 family RNA polymerase sigma factor [Actinomycetota bacterium]|nr:sigma-70 family RNA polymerase sigma factor [Actinomycetota bacterium]